MRTPHLDLRVAAARYVMGDLSTPDLVEIADGLLEQGIYSPAISELAMTRNIVMAGADPLFEQALEDLYTDIPSPDNAVWTLLRHHIGRIAYEDVPPRDGLRFVVGVYDRAHLYGQSQTYVGDSHGIQALIGAYWGYDDLDETSAGGYLKSHTEDIRELDEGVLRLATKWIGEYGSLDRR